MQWLAKIILGCADTKERGDLIKRSSVGMPLFMISDYYFWLTPISEIRSGFTPTLTSMCYCCQDTGGRVRLRQTEDQSAVLPNDDATTAAAMTM